jgi:hypothetical protein
METTTNAASALDTIRQIYLIELMLAKRKHSALNAEWLETAIDDDAPELTDGMAYEQAKIDFCMKLLATLKEIGNETE